jgi:uncharacterized membrane protein YoaK (UPF0700 family)
MMLDAELEAAWGKEVAREQDPAFLIAVMRRIESNLFRRALVMNVALVSAATLFFIIFAPMLTTLWRQSFAHFLNAPTLAFLLSVLCSFVVKISATPVPKARVSRPS